MSVQTSDIYGTVHTGVVLKRDRNKHAALATDQEIGSV